jgi:hypothetical protein
MLAETCVDQINAAEAARSSNNTKSTLAFASEEISQTLYVTLGKREAGGPSATTVAGAIQEGSSCAVSFSTSIESFRTVLFRMG